MTGGFFDRKSTPLGAGPEALHARTHVGAGYGNNQIAWINAEVVFGISNSRSQHLGYGPGGAIGHELEHDQRIAIAATTDLVENTSNLGHGTPHVAGVGKGLIGGEDFFCHLNVLLSYP